MFSDPFGLCPWCIAAAAGAATGVVEGYALSKLLGLHYTWKNAAVDAVLGAAGGALVSWLDKANDARRVVKATTHGAERLADASRLGEDAARAVMRSPTKTLTQGDGARVFLQEVEGRFNVVVRGDRGVVTTFKNLSEKSLKRLAKNYEWH
jgi:hypothetical protein